MIKKLLSIALVVVSISANAQQLKVGQSKLSTKQTVAARGVNPSPATVTIDTLMPASVMAGGCGLTGGLYNYICDAVAPMDSGYIFGTGLLNIGSGMSTSATEVAQKYTASSTGTTVTDILVLAGAANGGTVTTVGKVYSENAVSHKPNSLLGTSATVPMSAYSTTAYTAFHFAAAVAVPVGNFFAAVTVPAFGGADLDTLSVLSTQLGVCPAPGTADSCSAVKFGAPLNSWFLVKTGFGDNGDLMIFPVINITTAGINSYVNKGNLNLYAASPNPASNSININFSLANTSKVEIEVYDVAGKVIKTIKGNTEYSVGKNSINVDVTNFDSGSYIYSITTNGAKMFSKFVVAK